MWKRLASSLPLLLTQVVHTTLCHWMIAGMVVIISLIFFGNPKPPESPLLEPTNRLRRLCCEESKQCPYDKEYRLIRQPESLEAFVSLFSTFRLVWISDNTFVVRDSQRDKLPEIYRNQWFEVMLDHGRRHRSLMIYSSTLDGAITCVDFLVGLPDTHYEEFKLAYRVPGEIGRPHTCLELHAKLVEKMLQHGVRKTFFHSFILTPEQSRILVSFGSHVGLERCKFQDWGAAFVETLREKSIESRLAKMTILYLLPFNEENLYLLLEQKKIKSLTLSDIKCLSTACCRAVALSELEDLVLRSCVLVDQGAALLESVQKGRGPKGLCIKSFGMGDEMLPFSEQFDDSDRFISFLNALRNNTYLERLDLHHIFEHEILQALSAALLGNKGLTHLGLNGCSLNDSCWSDILGAISQHPSLRTLNLSSIDGKLDTTEAIKQIASMLKTNKHVEDIRFDNSTFDRYDWNKYDAPGLEWNKNVAPRLEYNLYQRRCRAIQKVTVSSTRAAVLANALAHVESKPVLLWMLLSQNLDTITSYQYPSRGT
jgi:hypothetical protein